MRRLYWQIYLSFIGILVLFGLLLAAAFTTASHDSRALDAVTAMTEELLPGPDASREELQRALTRLRGDLLVSATIWSAQLEPLASVGDELPRPDPGWNRSRFLPSRGAGFTLALVLSDGRFVTVRHHREAHAPASARSPRAGAPPGGRPRRPRR